MTLNILNLIYPLKTFISFSINEFKIKLPKNLENIEKYFKRLIKTRQIMKVSYIDQAGKHKNSFVIPKELMIFNQNIFLKAEFHPKKDEGLIPLSAAIFQDPELGEMKFENIANY